MAREARRAQGPFGPMGGPFGPMGGPFGPAGPFGPTQVRAVVLNTALLVTGEECGAQQVVMPDITNPTDCTL